MRERIRENVGAVVIGRNEGERLQRCLRSLVDSVRTIVYVDSGSTDGSVSNAQSMGVEVVSLDAQESFTAARARNAGWRRLIECDLQVRYVQFVDGDCEVVDGWIARAFEALEADGQLAVVCGRRRERSPESSVYNRMCDLEWNGPTGRVRACGGDAMMRLDALRDAGGFCDALIAGEEPELCLRLRRSGWSIERLDAEMTLHDAAMTRFAQWWKRAKRCGYAYADGYARHGRGPEAYRKREVRSIVLWTIVLPTLIVGLLWPTSGWSALGLLLYVVLWMRVARAYRTRASSVRDAICYGGLCVLGKFAEVSGIAGYGINRMRGRSGEIIEYKGPLVTTRDS